MSFITPQKTNGFAIASLVVGILAIFVGLLLRGGGYVGIIGGIVGFVCGMDGLNKSRILGNGRGVAIAGIVLSVLAFAWGVFYIIRITTS